jgi:hypothetical protein
MKTAKVIAFYFGQRRHYPHNKEGVMDLFKKQITAHRKINPGVEEDLIVVNHDPGDEDVRNFLSEYDNQDVFNGKIKIINRPRISNDLSFGSFKYAFHLLQKEYDYWFFSEDDITVLRDNVTKELIDTLNSDSQIGFVTSFNYENYEKYRMHLFTIENGYVISTGNHPPHAHGGHGLTSTNNILHVAKTIPSYLQIANINPSDNISEFSDYEGENNLEISFTNDFVKAGLKLKALPPSHSFLHNRLNTII